LTALYVKKLEKKQKLTAEEEEWDKVVARFDLVCSEAHKNNVSFY
jgi:proline dehydrogenase